MADTNWDKVFSQPARLFTEKEKKDTHKFSNHVLDKVVTWQHLQDHWIKACWFGFEIRKQRWFVAKQLWKNVRYLLIDKELRNTR